jgi:hypothetical protein
VRSSASVRCFASRASADSTVFSPNVGARLLAFRNAFRHTGNRRSGVNWPRALVGSWQVFQGLRLGIFGVF